MTTDRGVDAAAGPKVTVVTAVFNGAQLIQRCINSVAGQTYANVEHVVIDGGSTDGTVDILRANEAKLAFWVSERDEGIYDAWNKGVAKATGDWLIFLGCDDFFWNSESVAGMIRVLSTAYPKHPLVYGIQMQLDDDARPWGILGAPWQAVDDLGDWMMNIPNPSMFYHRELFSRYGPFDKSFRYAGDYEFILRVLKDSDPLFAGEVKVAGFQVGGVSNDVVTALKSLDEVCRARIKNGFGGRSPSWRTERRTLQTKRAIRRFLGRRALAIVLKHWRAYVHRGQRQQLLAAENERGPF